MQCFGQKAQDLHYGPSKDARNDKIEHLSGKSQKKENGGL